MNYKVIKRRMRVLNPVTNIDLTVLKTLSNSWINVLAVALQHSLASFNICVTQAGQTEELYTLKPNQRFRPQA